MINYRLDNDLNNLLNFIRQLKIRKGKTITKMCQSKKWFFSTQKHKCSTLACFES